MSAEIIKSMKDPLHMLYFCIFVAALFKGHICSRFALYILGQLAKREDKFPHLRRPEGLEQRVRIQ